MIVTENNFGYIKLDRKIMDEFGVDSSAASNMVNNFNFIKELYCWAFSSYDEKNDIYKINIRSRGPIINTVASKYNGGGHIFASGARIKDEIDVDNLFKELDGLFNERSYQGFIADVIEIENGYKIVGELPGVNKEDISIEFEDGVLYVSASIKVDDNEKYLLRERRNKNLRRTFSLGDIDEESIKAKFENGLLIVSVLFKEEVKKEKKAIIVE